MYQHLTRACSLLLLLVALAGCANRVVTSGPAQAVATSAPAPSSAPVASPIPTLPPTDTPAPTLAPPTATPEPPTATPEPPTATPEPITGALALPRGSVTERPYAVMLDNHPDAYPQSGLNGAAIVFEALAEFGITRYMAVFVPGVSPELSEIGPVRSARPYYVEWAKGLRAVYSHAGGSPEGLLLAETAIEIINNDALRGVSGPYFRRSGARLAPHNLYTDSADIAAFAASRGVETPDLSEIGFILKPEAPADQRPASQRLSYFFIYREAYVGWSYDPASNDYLYFRGSRPHVDQRTGAQIQFKNLVVMEVPEAPIPGDPKGRIEQQVLGEGKARIFRDGTMIEATWRKDAGFAQLRFYAADGSEVPMNPGPVWIAAIPSMDNLTVEGGL
ncbi:DUF3048 domain-containing protein [Oscillochloris sp. ZM17-4]|uniref:DUF3048 domain-containing protein n=1 Tax=Oscillochloris sp. ZM17-4 TaxID=2866714 RepID=UPI001C7312C1|nr:DUF3048 domain-containing protein [Oscillochloris sp. ZM17-4]MBX0326273.1 DUF3048 domain-containing protein [Oscillochloris sp. ZM17-4]